MEPEQLADVLILAREIVEGLDEGLAIPSERIRELAEAVVEILSNGP